jgi:DNA-directed RNA polymerase subunit RPC12/RpoP
METKTKVIICPRCKVNELNPRLPANALSRRDNKSYICSECGTDEAMIDYFHESEDLSWLDEVKDV